MLRWLHKFTTFYTGGSIHSCGMMNCDVPWRALYFIWRRKIYFVLEMKWTKFFVVTLHDVYILICLHTFFYRQPQYNIQSSRHSTSLHVTARHTTRKYIYKCYTSCIVTTKNSFITSVILHTFFDAIWKCKPVTARRSSSCCTNVKKETNKVDRAKRTHPAYMR
jgi:hypothetical protein